MKTMSANHAVSCGMGKIFIPNIIATEGIELPRSRSIEWMEAEIKNALRKKADAQAQIFAPTLSVEATDPKDLEKEVTWWDKMAKYANRARQLRIHNYPILSAEPLTWRDDEGFPRLVILPVDCSGEVEISANNGKNWQYKLSGDESKDKQGYGEFIREIIYPCYGDVGLLLINKCSYGGSISIKTSLAGLLLPQKTHKKIAAARAHFGHQLFIIAEAPQPWEVNVVVPPMPDPLIVGYDNGLLFLVDKFKLTRIERVVAAEFTLS